MELNIPDGTVDKCFIKGLSGLHEDLLIEITCKVPSQSNQDLFSLKLCSRVLYHATDQPKFYQHATLDSPIRHFSSTLNQIQSNLTLSQVSSATLVSSRLPASHNINLHSPLSSIFSTWHSFVGSLLIHRRRRCSLHRVAARFTASLLSRYNGNIGKILVPTSAANGFIH
ncbi:uncharacterized protein G2W53_017635 [Senna tora]|uniref:Uncharacterized protein n=1 Tax=Senna tora TaxID=362788 RepID=A0A834TTG7_9FABA|nr:uncharacterized protein G2W53_017635 [Senna tora]